jgi:hypothetical protein
VGAGREKDSTGGGFGAAFESGGGAAECAVSAAPTLAPGIRATTFGGTSCNG